MLLISLFKPDVLKIAARYNVIPRVDLERPTKEKPTTHIMLETSSEYKVRLIILFDQRRPKSRSTVYYIHAEGVDANIGLRSLLSNCNVTLNRTLLVWKEA